MREGVKKAFKKGKNIRKNPTPLRVVQDISAAFNVFKNQSGKSGGNSEADPERKPEGKKRIIREEEGGEGSSG